MMSPLFIMIFVIVLFTLGYTLYAGRLEKLIGPSRKRETPAHAKYDGIDYVPAQHWSILFGHHFASIAGAAPIIGPIIAISIWGWAPALIWVVLGTIFIGGAHDYCSLMVSVRQGGTTIADITKKYVSNNAKMVFLMFLWLTLILIIAVFVHLSAKTFVFMPETVLPSLGLIPLAVLTGYLLYGLRLNQSLITVLALAVLIVLIFIGQRVPIELGANAVSTWSVVLLVYSMIASVTPVQRLLQPRDYISSFLLFFGLLFGIVGLFVNGGEIRIPAVAKPDAGSFLPMWPFLFVTVACGAISGFHSIVASGTTSKQLSNERDAKAVGYGGMVAEGLLSAMTIMVIVVSFKSIGALADVVKSQAGPIGAFGAAYGQVTSGILGGYGSFFAIIILNAFILTTLDTATRLGRYISQELFNITNRYIATFLIIVSAGALALSGKWIKIWPIFGSANQLIAALALIVITSWLMAKKKQVVYILVPTFFMLVTTMGALVLKVREFVLGKEPVLTVISIVLLGLAIFVFIEALEKARSIIKERLKNA